MDCPLRGQSVHIRRERLFHERESCFSEARDRAPVLHNDVYVYHVFARAAGYSSDHHGRQGTYHSIYLHANIEAGGVPPRRVQDPS